MSLFDCSGMSAVISGGSGWLGRVAVRALSEAGAEVTVVGRDLQRMRDAFSGFEHEIHLSVADIRTDAWPEAIAQVVARSGRLDVLVNNAHIGRGGSLRTALREDYLEAFDLAVIAAAAGIEAGRGGFQRSIEAGGSPAVINVASMYGLVSPDPSAYQSEAARNPPYYGAAKAAMIQLTRYAAAELGPMGVRVNAIAPGPFPAEEAQRDEPFVQELGRRTMLGRVGRPEELASAFLYLASPASSFTTGAVLPVDGGWTAW